MRFKEIVSTQKIVDTYDGKEYNGLVDDELLQIFNDLADENLMLNQGLTEIYTIVRHLLGKQYKVQ